MTENNAEKYQKYEDINKGQKPEEVYTDFINTVKMMKIMGMIHCKIKI